MKLSQGGLNLIKELEGWSATSYPDAGGRSIGYGHFIQEEENFEEPLDLLLGEALLQKDVERAESALSSSLRVPLSQNQFDALVSFVYNVGVGAFTHSTLLRMLNEGDFKGVAKQFPRWIYSKGKVLDSLINRRKKERELFEKENS